MQKGYITASAYTSDARIPVQNALFTVVRDDPKGKELLGIRLTGESGKTTPVSLDAPDASLSQTPGNTDVYTSVNVRVDHPLYTTYYVTGAQVFAGQVSLINAPMLPTGPHIAFNRKAGVISAESIANL